MNRLSDEDYPMNDNRQSARHLPGRAVSRPATVLADDEALEYWIKRADWLNAAKLRVRAGHFRRDVAGQSR